MAILGSLSVKLGIVTQGFDSAINSAKGKLNDFESGVSSVNKALGMFGVAIGAATAIDFGKRVFDYADNISDLSKGLDVSVATVLKFRDALQQSGGEADDAQRIMGHLFDQIDKAKSGFVTDELAQKFAKLGLSIEDLKNMQPEEALTAVYRGLSKIGNTYERVALIKDLLGKSGLGSDVKNLADMMEESSEKFKNYEQSINKLADAKDKIDQLGTSLLNFSTKPLASFIDKTVEATRVQLIFYAALLKMPLKGTTNEITGINPLGSLNAPQTIGGFSGGINPLAGTDFDQSKVKPREFKLGLAQKDIEASQKQSILIKHQLEDLTAVMVTSQQIGRLNIDELLTTKSATAYVGVQLDLEKQRLALAGDSYKMSEYEIKLAQIELDKNEKINQLAKELHELENSSENIQNKQAKIDLINAEIGSVFQLSEIQKKHAIEEQMRQQTWGEGWRETMKKYKEESENTAQIASQAFSAGFDAMSNQITSWAAGGKLVFKDFANSVIQDIMRIIIRAQLMKIVTGMSDKFGWGLNIGGHAAGGLVDSPSIVGENGPELFVPNRPGTIIPNARVGDFMNNQQPQTVINGPYIASMQAIDTQSAAQFLAKNKSAVFAANQSALRGMPAGR